MIRQEMMEVISHEVIAKDIYEFTLKGAIVQEMNEPGQFVHLRTNTGFDPLLRRPISIADINKDKEQFTVIYRAEGKGTTLLSTIPIGDRVDVLGPLGHGFPIHELKSGDSALLVGGGIGVPPLYELAKQLNARGIRTVHVLGFETKEKVFYEHKFNQFGETYIATVDGSHGTKGFVTHVIEEKQLNFNGLFSCGPTPMLQALQMRYQEEKVAYLSLEERMGCGIGACFACVCKVNDSSSEKDYVKICSDGPVFPIGKVALS